MHTGLEQLMTEFSFFFRELSILCFSHSKRWCKYIKAHSKCKYIKAHMQRECCLDKLLCVFQWSVALQWICSLFHIWPLLFSRLKKKRIYIYIGNGREICSLPLAERRPHMIASFSLSLPICLFVCLSPSFSFFLSLSVPVGVSLSLRTSPPVFTISQALCQN